MKLRSEHTGWYFFSSMLLIFVVIYFTLPTQALEALAFFWILFKKILPVLAIVFVLLILFDYVISPKQLTAYLGSSSGIRGWIIALIGGIFSSGPIYMWYPLLSDLQAKGMRTGLLVTFLYARAIKLPLLPLLLAYFGLSYIVILTIVLLIMALVQGLSFETLFSEVNT